MQKQNVIGRRVEGDGSKCSARPVFIFVLKKTGFAPWPDIIRNETLIYYWQIFFSEAILHRLMIKNFIGNI